VAHFYGGKLAQFFSVANSEIPSQQMAMLVGSAMALSGEVNAQNLVCVVSAIGN
jgi:hypothetical protein